MLLDPFHWASKKGKTENRRGEEEAHFLDITPKLHFAPVFTHATAYFSSSIRIRKLKLAN
jgi:hypothetical protein